MHGKEQDFNAVLDRVEQMLKEGKLEELPTANPMKPTYATEVFRLANEQEAMGGFAHMSADEEKVGKMKIDPVAAERIHGKKTPKVHVETYGCQTTTENTTTKQAPSSQTRW